MTKCSASWELWYPHEQFHPLELCCWARAASLGLSKDRLSLSTRINHRQAETQMGSRDPQESLHSSSWNKTCSGCAKQNSISCSGIDCVFFFSIYTAETKYTFLILLSVFTLEKKCEKLTFCPLWRLNKHLNTEKINCLLTNPAVGRSQVEKSSATLPEEENFSMDHEITVLSAGGQCVMNTLWGWSAAGPSSEVIFPGNAIRFLSADKAQMKRGDRR